VTLLLNAVEQEYRGLRSKFKAGVAGSALFRFKRGM
jgi:hypothetical protein